MVSSSTRSLGRENQRGRGLRATTRTSRNERGLPLAEKLIFKGALWLTAWRALLSRATSDIDLLGRTSNPLEHIRVFSQIAGSDNQPMNSAMTHFAAPSAFKPAIPTRSSVNTNRLLWGVRKPLGNRSRVKVFVVVIRAQANHLITLLDLTGINSVHLLVGVILTDPLGGRVVMYGSLGLGLPHTDGERRFFRFGPHDLALHASRFRSVLREAGYRHREDNHDHEQHS